MRQIVNFDNRKEEIEEIREESRNNSKPISDSMLAYEKEFVLGEKMDEFTSAKGKKEFEEWSNGLLERLGNLQ